MKYRLSIVTSIRQDKRIKKKKKKKEKLNLHLSNTKEKKKENKTSVKAIEQYTLHYPYGC